MTFLVLAAALAVAPLDAPHAAVLNVLQQDGNTTTGCDPAELRAAAAGADLKRLGRVAGSGVVLASLHRPCLCGNVNCPYFVLRLGPGKPRLLYSTYGFTLTTVAAAPLPTLVFRAHDSALITDETVAAYRNGKYVEQTYARVRGDNGARKPNDVPVHFSAGASAATLRGTASTGWYDSYAFDAQAGQRVTIGNAHAKGTVVVNLLGPEPVGPLTVVLDKPLVLPKTGSYHLQIEVTAENDVLYSLTLAIR
jgi:hypothetical protein